MRKVAIATDSNSGITQYEAKELGISVLPMPFYINGELYLEDITLSQEQFYQKLKDDLEICTSQPSPEDVLKLWDELLKSNDEVVYIPMSSGLSGSYETAMMLSKDYNGKIQVANNQRISVTQRQSVLDAIKQVQSGESAEQIKDMLESTKFQSSIYITVDTLKYLKRGGRLTPAVAAIGTVLNIKPVLQIQGEKLDSFAKARGKTQAKKIMLDAVRKDLDNKFAKAYNEGNVNLHATYAGNYDEAKEWKQLIEENFKGFTIHMDPLSLSIACHIGQGALAVAITQKN